MNQSEKQQDSESDDVQKKLKEWQQFAGQNQLSGEWSIAARLGKTGFSDEEIHWVSEMFGR